MSIIEKKTNEGEVVAHPPVSKMNHAPGKLPWVIFGIGAFFFTAFAADTLMHGKLWQWDHALADYLKAHWVAPWNPLALWGCAAITLAGDVAWLTWLILMESFLLWRAKRRRDIWVLLLALVGSAVMIPVMKALFHQPRPIVTSYFTLTAGYNFPSGHTAGATIFLWITAYLWGRRSGPACRFFLMFAAFVFSLAVGASLVYIGAHYVTDVLAAWAFCAMWLSVCVVLARRISPL